MKKPMTVAMLFTLSGCTFVQLTDAGANVAQMGPGDVANCQDRGLISTQTKAKVVINRNKQAVLEELTVLARNEAATLGANAIVPIGEPDKGTLRFRAYLCQ